MTISFFQFVNLIEVFSDDRLYNFDKIGLEFQPTQLDNFKFLTENENIFQNKPVPKPGPSFVDPDDVDDDSNGSNDDDDDDDGPKLKRKRFGKNPDVDTSFLPDVERDEEENKLREQLRQVFNAYLHSLQNIITYNLTIK